MRRPNYFGLFVLLCGVLAAAGLVFTLFGFGFFPERILPREALLPWVSSIYGSLMLGWSLTLFGVGRLAFKRRDPALLRILMGGLGLWLLVEALASLATGVYFNIGVDLAVALLFALPLLGGAAAIEREGEGPRS